MRVVIELKRNENAEVVLNQLYKLTPLQDSFGINMVVLVDGQPRLLNLKQILSEFLRHRREVVTRRTLFRLKKARHEGHIAEGKAVALSNIDEIIKLIKESPNAAEAKEKLLARPWRSSLVEEMLTRSGLDLEMMRPEGLAANIGLKKQGYYLSEIQADAILRMSLRNLTGLDQKEIIESYKNLMGKIIDFVDILSKPERITQIIRDELEEIKTNYGDERRSEINPFGGDIADEDLIPQREMVVTLTHGGYIKTQPTTDYQAQRRGGRGKQAAATKDEDFIETLFVANTHDYLMCFTNLGKCHWIKVYKLPEGGRNSRGRPINNVIQLEEGEKVSAILAVREFPEDQYVFFATAQGMVKKSNFPPLKTSAPKALKPSHSKKATTSSALRKQAVRTTLCCSPTWAKPSASTNTGKNPATTKRKMPTSKPRFQTTSKTKPPTTKTPCQAAKTACVRPVAAAAVCAVCACLPTAKSSA